jgi:hypothetical protein
MNRIIILLLLKRSCVRIRTQVTMVDERRKYVAPVNYL